MSDETKLDVDATEARAKRDVAPCDTCGAPATKECSESECRASRCDAHAVFFDGHCTHRWWRRDNRPAETLALVGEVRRLTRERNKAWRALRDESTARQALSRAIGSMPFSVSDVVTEEECEALDRCTDEDHAAVLRAAQETP